MNCRSVLLKLILCVCFTNITSAQKFVLSPEINMRNDFSYFLIPIGEYIHIVRDKAVKIILQSLSKNNVWSSEKELSLEGKKWNILDVFPHQDKIGVIYISKIEREIKCYYSIYDIQGVKVYQRIIADSLNVSSTESVNFQSSEDRNFVSIGIRDLQNKSMIILFNRLEDSVYYVRPADDIFEVKMATADEAQLSNKGDFFLKFEVETPNKVKVNHYPRVIGINSRGFKFVDLTLKSEFETFSTKMAIHQSGDGIVLGGLFKKPNESGILGYFTYVLSEVETPVFHLFDEKKIKEWTGKKNKTSLTNYDLQLNSIRFLEDGSNVLIMENVKQYVRRPYFGAGLDNGGSFAASRWVDYYYDDIIVSCINTKKEKAWETILRKKQFSQDDDGINSSFFVVTNKSFLRFLFNDEIKNESTVSEYILLPNGQQTRKSVLNTSNSKLNLRIREAVQIDRQIILIPNESNNRLSILRLYLN